MNRLSRGLVVVLTICMLFGLCSSALAASKADEEVAAAYAKLEEAQSYACQMQLVMGMTMAQEQANMEANCQMQVINDPLKLKMEMLATVEAAGEAQTISLPVYALEEDGMLKLYMNLEGEWLSMEMPMEEFDSAQFQGINAAEFTQGLSGFQRIGGKAIIGARTALRYSARLNWEDMSQLMGEMDFSSMLGADANGMAWIFDLMESLYQDMGVSKVMLYIDEETGLPLRYEVDLTDALQQMMTNLVNLLVKEMQGQEALSPEDQAELQEMLSLQIQRYALTLDFSDVNQVKDFKIPSAVKNADPIIGAFDGALDLAS